MCNNEWIELILRIRRFSLNKTIIGAAIVVLALLGAGGLYLSANKDSNNAVLRENNSSNNTESTFETFNSTGDEATSELKNITAKEVAQHNSSNDCWTIIEDKVYDLTSYVSRHPGGQEILRACGSDGTSLFKERKTSDGEAVGSGSPHSSSAQAQLDDLIIGVLAN